MPDDTERLDHEAALIAAGDAAIRLAAAWVTFWAAVRALELAHV